MNKLLLIDDEPDILKVLSMYLRADCYQVHTALSGAEGLEIFDIEHPRIVLTDIRMPGMDGIEVLKRIKEASENTEVIIITGHGDLDLAIEALQNGASDFINKPVRGPSLEIALKRAEEKLEIREKLAAYTQNLEKEVRLATRELCRQSNFLSRLIRSSTDGIVATDEDFNVVVFNPGAERIFGRRAEDVINTVRMDALFPGEIAGTFMNEDRQMKDREVLRWRETTIQSADSSLIPVGFSGAMLREKDRVMGSVAFFQDLREIKRLEKELLHSERLAAIGQTVAGLTHGIKNVLHGFKGGSYLVDLGIDKGESEKLTSGWDMVKRNIARTSDLVMDLLSYSKEREPEYEDCRPHDIAADVIETVRDTAEENGIALIADFDPTIGTVRMDPRIVHTSLLNLMTNAIDACIFDEDTSKKWQVSLKMRLEEYRVIRFEVSDNGTGMTDEVREKLFGSFFSTKGHRGTGLGMLVTQKLIEEHNGTIDVSTQPGKGSTFSVRLPLEAAGTHGSTVDQKP